MCNTYIIYSKAIDRFYIGYTCTPIELRIEKHIQNHKGFTGRAKDWEIVWSQEFSSKTEAYAMERKIKSWKSRTKIQALINE